MATIPSITKISPKIIRILGCNPSPMTLQGTNTYLIGSGKRRILLDAGDPNVKDYIGHLKRVIMDERIIINDIIVSHWHHDHVGGVDDVLNAIENGKSCKVWKYRRTDAPEPVLKNAIFHELRNGQKFVVEGSTLEVIHTPGHTTDHVVLFLHEDKALFSADCILGEGTSVFEDLYDYMKSLQLIRSLNPAVIYPGHGNIINDPEERITAYINHRNKREVQILAVLQRHPEDTFSEIQLVKLIYKDLQEQLWPAAALNVNHHLCKLVKDKKVTKDSNGWKFFQSASL